MSGADYFSDQYAINAHMDSSVPIDILAAMEEHAGIRAALETAGIQVTQIAPPESSQDGVYTANWALVRGDKAVLARLPNVRKSEELYAESVLMSQGKQVVRVPDNLRFSGQGDALACGDYLFMGSDYRTDQAAHDFVGHTLGYEVISLLTIPKRRWFGLGPAVTNKTTGWPDSYYYDLDLALAILRGPTGLDRGLIAWCPEAFTPESRARMHVFDGVEKIEVSRAEATNGLACNLVSTGETVIMSAHAPKFQRELEKRGFKVITPKAEELKKGGGFIRCITLTLD